MLRDRYLFACYLDLVKKKHFQDFFTDKVDLKNSFAKMLVTKYFYNL